MLAPRPAPSIQVGKEMKSPANKVNLDKLFSSRTVDSNAVASGRNDREILTEAVNAIAVSSKPEGPKFRLFDPQLAKVSRLFAGESLACWLARASGLVKDQDVIKAFELAQGGNDSILDILNRSGKLTHCDMKSVQHAEVLVTEGLIYRGFAASAIRLASREYVDLLEALETLDLHPQRPFAENKLVVLLSKIGFLDADKVLAARQEALSKGITIGWSLIKNDLVDEQLIKVLIESNFAIRDKRINIDELVATAVLAISSQFDTGRQGLSPESIMVSELDVTTLDRTFGNLLLGSTILGIEELLFCAEVACEEDFMLEEVVEHFGLVEPTILNGACQLARMLLNKSISAKDCTVMLSKLKATGKPLSELMPNAQNINTTLEFTVPPNNSLSYRTA